MSEYVEVSGTFLHQTPNGIKVDFGFGEETWLPKSQIELVEHTERELVEGDIISVEVPEWLAMEKGLI